MTDIDIDNEWMLFLNQQNSPTMEEIPPPPQTVVSEDEVGSRRRNVVEKLQDGGGDNIGEEVGGEVGEQQNIANVIPYDLFISTKTKVLFLNKPVDIHNIFWRIRIIEYWQPLKGVIKKQIKVVSKTKEELEEEGL